MLRLVHSLNFWSAEGNLFMRTSIPVQTIFGNHIRQLREQTRLTVEQLSEKSGFSSHRLRAIERGEINLNLGTMLILALALDTTLQDLLSGVALKLHHQEFFEHRIIPFSRYRKAHQHNEPQNRATETTMDNLQNQNSPATPLQGIAEELSLAGLPGCMGTLCRSVATGRDLENSVAAT